jgi:hypothetical protein
VEAKFAMVVVAGRIKLMRSMDPAPIDNHHHLFLGFPEGSHHLVDILAQLLGIKVRHDFIEDFRGAILDGTDNAEQHAARDAAPGAIRQPRLAFEAFFAFDVALAQGTGGQTRALGFAPPTCPGQGKAPQDCFVFIEQNDLTPACSVLQGSEFDRAIGEIGRGGIKPPSGTAVG